MKAEHYEDIGQYLKDVRESQDLTLEEAAQAMHIRPHYLTALEAGNFDALPGKAYIRGYIRNYALLLGIKPEEVLTAIDTVAGTEKQEYFIPEPTVKENLPSASLLRLTLIAVAVLAAGYLFFSHKEKAVVTPAVAEVSPEVLFALYSPKDKRIAQWEKCLKSNEMSCFSLLYSRDVLGSIQKQYVSYRALFADNQ